MAERLSRDQRRALQALVNSDPASWMERNFYIEDPRDPYTGALKPPGPIILHPKQKRLLRAALLKDTSGFFPYSTVVYSTIKKSGKTRIAAGVGAWFAATQGPYQEIYCLANDGKQSSDRVLEAIKRFVRLNPNINWHVTRTRITLPNGTFIEAIPCDPTGSAGANPSLTLWSEMWGYRHQHKERLWSEMTIPPTRQGRAIRWVESYAGYSDESNVLYSLYELGTMHSRRHPSIPELPVYINDVAKMICYWDSGDAARRMPWQTEEYYAQEAQLLTPAEFDRIHRNLWVTSVDKAIPIEWWDACQTRVPPLDSKTPVVMGLDAAVTHDCCAATLVSRHPKNPDKETMIRAFRAWEPPRGGAIDLESTVEKTLYEWADKYNLVEVAYDKYQLVQMMQRARRNGIKVLQFDQGAMRNLADESLYEQIVNRRIAHGGNSVLRSHVDNAACKTTGEKYRFIRPTQDSDSNYYRRRPIDGLVATSQGDYRCRHLNLA